MACAPSGSAEAALRDWHLQHEYEQFNKHYIFELFRYYNMSYRDPHREYCFLRVRTGGRQEIVKYTNKERIALDIKFLMVFGTGQQATPFRAHVVKMLKEKYHVQPIISGQPISASAITIQRIRAIFPPLMCDMYALGFINVMYTFAHLGITITPATSLSRAILCPHFASLIPHRFIKLGILNINLVFFMALVMQDNMSHMSNLNFTPLEDLFQYYVFLYFNWGAVNARVQLKYCSDRGLLNSDKSNFVQCITEAVWKAEPVIRNIRYKDPRLNEVIANLRALK